MTSLMQSTLAINASAICIPAVSCSLSQIPHLDGCCINDPSGHFLQTQFWDTSPALGASDSWTIHGLWPDYCKGGFDAYCNNTRSRSAQEITQIIAKASAPKTYGGSHPGLMEFMTKHWLSNDYRNANLWQHEWNKHGTCISTLEPQCYYRDRRLGSLSEGPQPDSDVLDYFTHAALLFSTLPTYQFFATHGVHPSHEKTYDLEHLQRAIRDSSHGYEATIKCRNHNELSEIWYHFLFRGNLRNAMDEWWDGNKQWNSWIATNLDGLVSNCPKTGIRYLPKDSSSVPPVPTATRTTTSVPSASNTHVPGRPSRPPFTGRGHLMVKVDDDTILPSSKILRDLGRGIGTLFDSISQPVPERYTGCLIRNGAWYKARSETSCAIFTALEDVRASLDIDATTSDNDDDYHLFTLSTRLAPCSFIPDLDFKKGSISDTSTFFTCSPDLPVQGIMSNNATKDPDDQDYEAAKRLTIGTKHQYTFYAKDVPRKGKKEQIWADDGGDRDEKRRVKVELYWETI